MLWVGFFSSCSRWGFHCRGFCCGARACKTGFRWKVCLGFVVRHMGSLRQDKPVSLIGKVEPYPLDHEASLPELFCIFCVFLSLACWMFMCLVYTIVARWQCLNQSLNQFLSLSLFSFSIFEDHYRTYGALYVFDIFLHLCLLLCSSSSEALMVPHLVFPTFGQKPYHLWRVFLCFC